MHFPSVIKCFKYYNRLFSQNIKLIIIKKIYSHLSFGKKNDEGYLCHSLPTQTFITSDSGNVR